MAYTKVTPNMTSNTTPSGVVTATAGMVNFYQAFDGVSGTACTQTSGVLPQSITYDFGTATAITAFRVLLQSGSGQIKNFNLQGSNDGSTWVPLSTVSAAVQYEIIHSKIYRVAASYKSYRLEITATFGGNIELKDIELLSGTDDYPAYEDSVVTRINPVMTGYTTPSGEASAGSEFAGQFAWLGFDGVETFPNWWDSNNDGTPNWLQYEFATAVEVTGFRFASPGAESQPRDFKFQGYNGSTWDDLRDISGYANLEVYEYTENFRLSTTGSYTRYRLFVTEIVGPEVFMDVPELEMLGPLGTVIDVPPLQWDMEALPPEVFTGEVIFIPAIQWNMEALAPELIVGPVSIEVPAVVWDMAAKPPSLIIEPSTTIPSTTIYEFVLTGDNDALPDIVIPIASLQARYRDGNQSWLSVVVPDAVIYADDITARPNGDMVLYRGVRYFDGSEQLVKIITVAMDQVSDDWGGTSRSVTLSGHGEFVNQSPKPIELEDVTYRASGTGKKRFRSNLDLNLRPGDTAVFDVEEIVVANITYTVDTSQETMEITEA